MLSQSNAQSKLCRNRYTVASNVANLTLGKPVTHAKTQNKKQYESGCK
jgi:hypothetical protein